MTIDNAARAVRFEQGALRAGDEGVIPLLPSEGLWDVALQIGVTPVKLLFDTQGGGMGAMVYADVAASLSLEGPLTTVGFAQSPAFGVVPKRVARLADTVRVAGFSLPRAMLVVQDNPRHTRDGILGIDVLSQFTTTLDQANRLVRFNQASRVLPDAAPLGGRGITVSYSRGPVRVLGVAPDSPGEAAGIARGDVILDANGVSTAGFGPADWDSVHTAHAPLVLRVDRGGVQRTVTVPYKVFIR
jgi:hypothetical protein